MVKSKAIKSSVANTFGVKPKRVTSDWAHLRVFTSEQHSSRRNDAAMASRLRDSVYNMTAPAIEHQIYCTDSDASTVGLM